MRRETSASMDDLSRGIRQLTSALAAGRGPAGTGAGTLGALLIGGAQGEYGAREPVDSSEEAASNSEPVPAASADEWRARFDERADDWRHGLKLAYEIAELPGEEGVRLMTELWPSLSLAVREQAMKPWVFGSGKAEALRILDLAATDAELSVQNRAFMYLKDYAFQDFSED